MKSLFIQMGAAALAIASGAAALAADLPDVAPAKVTYLCDGGTGMSVSYSAGGADLIFDGGTVHLAQQPVASGMAYQGESHELRGKGPEAIWTLPTGETRKCRDQDWAMKQPQIQEPMAQLGGTSWALVHFQSMDDAIGKVTPPRLERYKLDFMEDGTLAMQLDCNRGRARWKAEPASPTGGGLTITPAAMTRAMCGAGAMDTRIAMDMVRIRSFTLSQGQLNLALEADAGIYVWRPEE